ncbi:relaxase/mobilization nuclease domain-containing protein [Dyadobacter sp.]|uniref:relaxase/mobilization nuclease domain-containing protein n=1 Tax=Dyadobacter sp. TaxID=1914288 RepID=UPI003F6F2A49
MVAVIHTSSRLRAVLQYNENKLEQGHAECISAINYPKDADALSFDQELNRIQRQLALNKRTKVNTVHVSLNFDPSERLSKEQLAEISKAYLEVIGFEKQPALEHTLDLLKKPRIKSIKSFLGDFKVDKWNLILLLLLSKVAGIGRNSH